LKPRKGLFYYQSIIVDIPSPIPLSFYSAKEGLERERKRGKGKGGKKEGGKGEEKDQLTESNSEASRGTRDCRAALYGYPWMVDAHAGTAGGYG
jgi:hypothetical protein